MDLTNVLEWTIERKVEKQTMGAISWAQYIHEFVNEHQDIINKGLCTIRITPDYDYVDQDQVQKGFIITMTKSEKRYNIPILKIAWRYSAIKSTTHAELTKVRCDHIITHSDAAEVL